MYREGRLAPSMRESVITLLYKRKGDATELRNWRPISLLGSDLKILAKTLIYHLQKSLPQAIGSDQTCGAPGRSALDNLSADQPWTPELEGGPRQGHKENRWLAGAVAHDDWEGSSYQSHRLPDPGIHRLNGTAAITLQGIIYGPPAGLQSHQEKNAWRVINTTKQTILETRNIKVFHKQDILPIITARLLKNTSH
ncbi:hypothetical protein UPYG_G00088970 [Umbra pygmaea]|uniref:Uncharacterized protein n=1 Tax=Umbra pygmaea TaxID=75934 RepID=A0ABD0Y4N4_UMBPY